MSIFIAVIGGSQVSAEKARLAEEVGRELARRGAVVVCGGLGGVMEAVCKGARSLGGLTVGILPGDDRQSANRYVQIPVVTGIGFARNAIVVKSAHAVIAVDGSYGTLSEIAYALQEGKPVIGLNTWQFTCESQPNCAIVPASEAAEAAEKAIAAAQARGAS